MNLTTDPWIPVVWENGRSNKVSLLDAFQQGDQIRDLAVRPHERIALMRLLICVAQAALDGPKDHAEWKTSRDRLPQAAIDYLGKWKHVFELFGDGQRFLQVKAVGAAPAGLDKINFVDADMTTLFNPEVAPDRIFEEDWIVFRLLTYQAFSAGGACGGSFRDTDGKLKPQKGKNGPCRDGSAFHCYLRASCLVETIYRNLVTSEDILMLAPLTWGRPVWELESASSTEFLKHTEIGGSYLGRLVPVSRAMWLQDDRQTVLVANGLNYSGLSSDGLRFEPAVAVKQCLDKQGKETRRPVGAKQAENIRHPWRELQSVLMSQRDGVGGPMTFRNVDESSLFDLWLGAFVTDQAKALDSVEFVFARVPPELLLDGQVQNVYAQGVSFSSKIETRLLFAVECYRIALENFVSDGDGAMNKLSKMRRSEKERVKSLSASILTSYWTKLELQVGVLIAAAIKFDLQKWRAFVSQSARAAYELACPHDTPRQLKAYALGLKILFKPVESQKNETDTEETEE